MDYREHPPIWRNPVHFLAFGFGSGTAPKAPGTFGTLAAVLFYFLLADLALLYYTLFLVFALLLGVYLCGKTAKDLGVHDHPGIVWDEFVGYWIAMWNAPQGLWWVVIGFLLFRLFDIFKPWPISWLDRHIEGGWGIMLDDVVAGLLAYIGIFLLAHWFA